MNEIGFKELAETPMKEEFSDIPAFIMEKEVMEFAPSLEVQAQEIKEAFNDIPEMRFENWEKLSIEQRTEVLNTFEKKIAEVEMRPPMPVIHQPTRATLLGSYDGNRLMISDNLMGNSSYEAYRETLNTLFHEGRHAYQFYNLEHRVEQSGELVEAWRVNIQELGYEKGKNSLFDNNGFLRYFTQPVEVDARVAAETFMNALGG